MPPRLSETCTDTHPPAVYLPSLDQTWCTCGFERWDGNRLGLRAVAA